MHPNPIIHDNISLYKSLGIHTSPLKSRYIKRVSMDMPIKLKQPKSSYFLKCKFFVFKKHILNFEQWQVDPIDFECNFALITYYKTISSYPRLTHLVQNIKKFEFVNLEFLTYFEHFVLYLKMLKLGHDKYMHWFYVDMFVI